MSRERLGNVLSETNDERRVDEGTVPIERGASPGSGDHPDAEAEAFIRFCYRRRRVQWPELYDEMCAVAARGDYRGMEYEELSRLGIGFALSSLPRLAQLADRVIAQERRPKPVAAVA
ncbi:MAG: hypothetical protein AB1Z67_05395 [Candidatus Limnocylindrales bacterium]